MNTTLPTISETEIKILLQALDFYLNTNEISKFQRMAYKTVKNKFLYISGELYEE